MADDLVEVHGRCGRRFAALVAGVGPEHWHDDTPCSEWDVRTLVHHLLSEQRWVPPMFDGLTIEQVGDRFEGDLLGDDAPAWPGLLASATEEAHAVVAQPGALERTVHLSFGDASGQELRVGRMDGARRRLGRAPRIVQLVGRPVLELLGQIGHLIGG